MDKNASLYIQLIYEFFVTGLETIYDLNYLSNIEVKDESSYRQDNIEYWLYYFIKPYIHIWN